MKLSVTNIMIGIIGFTSTQLAVAESTESNLDHNPQQIIECFDKDGDGELNKSERQTVRAALKQLKDHRTQRLQRFDTDGDGKLSKEERKAARKQSVLKKFDTDKDGVLSEEERAAAQSARQDKAS